MPGKRSGRIEEVKQALLTRLREGAAFRPGDRFLSAREMAAEYGVSYQTADRLLDELAAEGLLERRAASGTYIPGAIEDSPSPLLEARLIFSARARRPNSFGSRLLAELTARLRREGIAWQLQWESPESAPEPLPADSLPILWEAPQALAACRTLRRAALLLNARPAPGLDATLLDSVSVDDAFGGACAADLLLQQGGVSSRPVVLTGPEGDARSDARRDGFLSRAPGAAVIVSGGWYVENGRDAAPAALVAGSAGIFCANDRLAEGVLLYAAQHGLPRPRLVGFDDAPVAAVQEITTIAIPWGELAADAADIIRRRLAGDVSAARQRLVIPRPVIRRL